MNPDRALYLRRLGMIAWELRATPASTAPVASANATAVIEDQQDVTPGACSNCGKQPLVNVVTTGKQDAEWMIVAGWENSALPFADETAALFDRMLQAVGFQRDDVCLASAVECTADQPTACEQHLNELVNDPARKVVLCMGELAARSILGTDDSIEILRGTVQQHANGMPVIVTFHPQHLLRVPADKRKTWEDLQLAVRVTMENLT